MILHKKVHRAKPIATMFAAIALTFGTGASAEESADLRYTVAVISDAAQGRLILKERYETAIEKLEPLNPYGLRGFNTANNLCVAYIKVGDKTNAKQACQLAVERIQHVIDFTPAAKHGRNPDQDYGRLLAIALSNLGVTYVINADHELARAAFTAAIDTEADAREPFINLARLDQQIESEGSV
jgi:tetratricopeptide (TPR) repeat protein